MKYLIIAGILFTSVAAAHSMLDGGDADATDAFFAHAEAKADEGGIPQDAIPFSAGEIPVNKGLVESIEFDKDKVNVTLKNTTDKSQHVNLAVFVLSKQAIGIWIGHVGGVASEVSPIDPAEKKIQTLDFDPKLPLFLNFFPHKNTLDVTPTWIVIREVEEKDDDPFQ